MAIATAVRGLTQLLSRNAPAILTGLGVVGLVGTTALAIKATSDAKDDIRRAALERSDEISSFHPDEFTRMEILEIVWKRYIPVALSCGVSIVCIIGAQTMNAKRIAALVSVYALSEQTLKEYQDKTLEVVGEKKERQIREKIAEERIACLEDDDIPMAFDDSKIVFLDPITGRTFISDIESIRAAVNDVNLEVINHMSAPHNVFYQSLGLDSAIAGDELGWNTSHKMDVRWSAVSRDGKPIFMLDYVHLPIRDYDRIWGS
jgi:hypothetical protein